MTTRNERCGEGENIKSRLHDYYSLRAGEYERVYEKPERQPELTALRQRVKTFAAGERVLDVACGTGYWTSVLAEEAVHVHGIDRSMETLRVAVAKDYPRNNVTFAVADAFVASYRENALTASVACFWLSHVAREEQVDFVQRLVKSVGKGSRFLLIDSCFVEGSSTAISDRDSAGNTFQDRVLSDGSRFRVMKNFYTHDELYDLGTAVGTDVSVQFGRYFWVLELSA